MAIGSHILIKEKIGYGLGDFASSMFWKLFSVYLLYYYTDVFGLAAGAVGTMFLVTRIWDTALDPLIGIIGDRTKTRFGKFRPYLLWMAVPFAIIGVLTFTAPDLSDGGKLIYAYVTYTLMMMIYSAVNVPYASLMGVITPDIGERTSLSSFRFIFAFAGSIFVLGTAEPLVDYFGNTIDGVNDARKGWQWTSIIYAIIAAVGFYLTFAWTKERVHPPEDQHTSLKNDLRDLLTNRPWFILLGAGVSTLIFNSLRDGAAIYYFKYAFSSQSAFYIPLTDIVVNLSTLYLVLGQAANIMGVLLVKPVSDRLGKRNSFRYAMLIATLLSLVFYFPGQEDIAILFVLQFLISVCAGIIFPLLWSMYGDIADYSEFRTGRRATGLIFSSSSMAQKLGWTMGGALTGWLLASYGFQANVLQTEGAVTGIRLMMSVFPAIGALVAALMIGLYKLSDPFMVQISEELAERRQNRITAESQESYKRTIEKKLIEE